MKLEPMKAIKIHELTTYFLEDIFLLILRFWGETINKLEILLKLEQHLSMNQDTFTLQ
jgi:hypothetical protein